MNTLIIIDEEMNDTTIWPCDSDDIEQDIEEALYVLFELTPTHRDWYLRAVRFGQCLFDYHGLNHSKIHIVSDGQGTTTIRVDSGC